MTCTSPECFEDRPHGHNGQSALFRPPALEDAAVEVLAVLEEMCSCYSHDYTKKEVLDRRSGAIKALRSALGEVESEL